MESHISIFSDNGVKGVHDITLNSSLGRVRHVQQVAPGRHPVTVCKNILKIGHWNVQTMYQPGKLDNIRQEMDRIKFNILGIAETRWTGTGKIETGNKVMIYSGGKKIHERGVAIIFDQNTGKSLKGWWGVSDRVIVAKLEGKPFDIGIIQVYAPTSTHSDEEVEEFYEDIDKAMKLFKSQDIKIVMGDFNAKVGNERIDDIVGSWGLGSRNERGDRLIDWCRQNEFIVSNTWFKNHPRRIYTWISPGDRTRNQIDYILVQKRFRNAIKTAKALPGADCGSDHNPVMCNMKIRLKKLMRSKIQPKYQIGFLKTNEQMKNKFVIDIKNRFAVLGDITEAEELYNTMKKSINEAIKENIPQKTRKEDKKWMTNEILGLMDERRLNKSNETKHKILSKQIKSKCAEAKEKWINDQCLEIETKQISDSKYVHSKIREISGKRNCTNVGCIRSKNGEILMDKNDILDRWSEYIEELFSDNRNENIVLKRELDGPPILKEEVQAAIKKMKSGKATGPDNIPIEIITTLEDLGIEVVTKLLNSIYDSGNIPKEMLKSVFIALPKSPGATECELHRTISLMSHFTKVLLRVIINRMRKSLRPEISNTQFGYVPDKGTRNAIFTLSMLMERCIEVQKDLYICFIDYTKAFDKVRHNELIKILEKLEINGKDLRIVRNLYWEQKAAVRVNGECSEFKPIKRGVRQGCVMSPDLFNLYSESILRNLETKPGIKVEDKNINNIRYADDTVLIAETNEALQSLINIVVRESERMGLSLNVKKTECMVISKKHINPECSVNIRGDLIKQVQKFKYLGYIITSDGRCSTEIKRRIAIAKDSFTKMKSIFRNHDISMATKFRVLKAYVWSVLLYGCECWTITEELKKKLEAAEMWFIRKMLRVSWTEKKTNEAVLEEAGIKRSLIKTIRKRQLQFLGHLNRHKGFEHLALTGKIDGNRSRGRQRIKFLDSLNNWTSINLNKKPKDNSSFLAMSENRDVWRAMITDVCFRPGT